MRIIGLTGRARSGKTTAASFLQELGYIGIALADPVKDAAAAMFGVERWKFDDAQVKEVPIEYWHLSPRQMAQQVGTEAGRNVFGQDLWLRRARREIDKIATQTFGDLRFVITDVRFDNEADWVRRLGGRVILIERPGDPIPSSSHTSEAGVSHNLVNNIVVNSGDLADLRRHVLIAAGHYDFNHGEQK